MGIKQLLQVGGGFSDVDEDSPKAPTVGIHAVRINSHLQFSDLFHAHYLINLLNAVSALLRCKTRNGLLYQFAQFTAIFPVVLDDFLAHSWFPGFPQVVENAFYGRFLVGIGIEKVANVIGHFYQSFCVMHGYYNKVG
jgi:hypothetical protein